MKQHQAPKETPRTNDKFKTVAFRCDPTLHKEVHKYGRGSAWLRRVVALAVLAEQRGASY